MLSLEEFRKIVPDTGGRARLAVTQSTLRGPGTVQVADSGR